MCCTVYNHVKEYSCVRMRPAGGSSFAWRREGGSAHALNKKAKFLPHARSDAVRKLSARKKKHMHEAKLTRR